jgi:hypothetical protein
MMISYQNLSHLPYPNASDKIATSELRHRCLEVPKRARVRQSVAAKNMTELKAKGSACAMISEPVMLILIAC